MHLRLKKHNCSMHRTLWVWKIQYRRGSRWTDVHSHGRLLTFDYTPDGLDRATNYMRQMKFPGVVKSVYKEHVRTAEMVERSLRMKQYV
jgi:hypothetical protein